MSDIKFLDPTHQGWHRCWVLIKAKYGDEACYEDGEAWQYMGSTATEHQFRHRNYKGKRTYEAIPVQDHDFWLTAVMD
jgi:hypothetical protein